MAVQTIPPFLLAGSSSILAALILMFLSRAALPTILEWKASIAPAFFMIVLGNGAVVWAEQFIPSTTTALMLATEPAWLIVLDRVFFKGPKVSRLQVTGVAVGFLGVGILLLGSAHADEATMSTHHTYVIGLGMLILAAFGWTLGSLMCRSKRMPQNSAMAIALPVLLGGVALLVAAIASGEMSRFDQAQISPGSATAFVYIVIVCYVATYGSYIWLIKNISIAQVSTYAYINPLVAAFLGVIIAGESLGLWTLIGGGVIVAATFLIIQQQKRRTTHGSQ